MKIQKKLKIMNNMKNVYLRRGRLVKRPYMKFLFENNFLILDLPFEYNLTKIIEYKKQTINQNHSKNDENYYVLTNINSHNKQTINHEHNYCRDVLINVQNINNNVKKTIDNKNNFGMNVLISSKYWKPVVKVPKINVLKINNNRKKTINQEYIHRRDVLINVLKITLTKNNRLNTIINRQKRDKK